MLIYKDSINVVRWHLKMSFDRYDLICFHRIVRLKQIFKTNVLIVASHFFERIYGIVRFAVLGSKS